MPGFAPATAHPVDPMLHRSFRRAIGLSAATKASRDRLGSRLPSVMTDWIHRKMRSRKKQPVATIPAMMTLRDKSAF